MDIILQLQAFAGAPPRLANTVPPSTAGALEAYREALRFCLLDNVLDEEEQVMLKAQAEKDNITDEEHISILAEIRSDQKEAAQGGGGDPEDPTTPTPKSKPPPVPSAKPKVEINEDGGGDDDCGMPEAVGAILRAACNLMKAGEAAHDNKVVCLKLGKHAMGFAKMLKEQSNIIDDSQPDVKGKLKAFQNILHEASKACIKVGAKAHMFTKLKSFAYSGKDRAELVNINKEITQ